MLSYNIILYLLIINQDSGYILNLNILLDFEVLLQSVLNIYLFVDKCHVYEYFNAIYVYYIRYFHTGIELHVYMHTFIFTVTLLFCIQ